MWNTGHHHGGGKKCEVNCVQASGFQPEKVHFTSSAPVQRSEKKKNTFGGLKTRKIICVPDGRTGGRS
jgi:hypothetical protein